MKTDAQLKSDVLEELSWEPTVTASDINVVAEEGIVTLSGTVPHFAEKWAAERATQRVVGVKAIAEEIKVEIHGTHKHPDSEIAEAVVNSLKWHVWVPNHVSAVVEDGWVTLSGIVDWGYQRNAAEYAVGYLTGVKGVTNNIALKPSVQAKAVKEAIEKALKRNAEINSEHIRVTADGGKVTLAGTVDSWDQRQEAGSAAWNAPGVTAVENDLGIA